MKINETLYGFLVKRAVEIKDAGATLYEAEHIKSGARLLFFDREDENKTFSIAFKTIPEDSTGVFHIIEHSVLCGSKKFRVKEPFVELLKGSLNTFLNAMTFPDKTMYPVASRNDKDFFNLTDVYLDAVFHPAILENKNIFLQEGWHYEFDSESGKLTRSGVVLNEMRGAFSSPDEVAAYHINEMLYPDTCYRFESGGEPSAITELSYEEFCDGHRKYYHPSNSEIFLDGSVNLDEILPLIDSYLSEYERRDIDFDIPDQPKIAPVTREIEYEISPGESPVNKTRLELGYLANRFDDQETAVALSVLLDAVASTNESPLKKEIIDSGLCEEMSFIPLDSIKQNSVTVDFKNVREGKWEELFELFISKTKELCERGIDKPTLSASLNSLEFKMREKDYGTMPIGLVYAMSALETSLYGGDPAQNLSYEKSFKVLREKLDTDYFERLLLSLFVENGHRAILVMHPSATLGEERAKKEAQELSKIKDSLKDSELSELIKTDCELKKWQQQPDTPEGLATIPALKLSDISADVEKTPQTVKTKDVATVLSHPIHTNGISYVDLCFDVSDLTADEIFDLRILISLIENVKTEKHSAIELQNLMKSELGGFSASVSPLTNSGKTKIYAIVSASALESKKDAIADITEEILYTSVYEDKETIHNVIKQLKMASDEAFIGSGHLAAFRRASAYINAESAVQEYYSGYEAHTRIKALDSGFDGEFSALCKRLRALSKKIFTRERLTLAITGAACESFEEKLISIVRSGESCSPVSHISPLGIRREGIVTPSQSAYAALAENVYNLGAEPHGSLNVARSLLSYGYLWGEVRVQGGAYGVGLLVRKGGNLGFYSYRDPSPERTLGCYKKSSAFLREFAKSGEDVTKFIIGAVGDASPLTTPKLKGTLTTMQYLRGESYESRLETKRQMLNTDAIALEKIADIIDRMCDTDAICVVGGKDKLMTCKELETLIEI